MRSFSLTLPICIILAAPLVSAQQKAPKTDARQDGLLGPVKSVSTVSTRATSTWQQPDGPTLVLPVWCQSCAYDADGTRTTSGQINEGKFLGQLFTLRRDPNGRVVERTATDAATGQVQRHEIDGPFGKTEETDYDAKGNVQAVQTLAYDQYGHMRDWLTVDADGKQQSHTVRTSLQDGTLTEETVRGKDDQLDWQQVYNPDTDTEHFTTFDQSGAVKLTWTYSHGKILSFWERPGQPNDQSQFGEGFIEPKENGNVDNYRCHEGGQCVLSRIHYDYLNPDEKLNPTTAEWRDEAGNLLTAAYCEYQVDSHGNWTHRKVTVFSAEQGTRAPYEEDTRTITYWEK